MKKFLIATALVGVFIHLCSAGNMNCGCAPGQQGQVGRQGNAGLKGESGDVGDPGIRGYPGMTGLPGAKGARGPQGAPGLQPPIWIATFPGPAGPPGQPGGCGCVRSNPFAGQQVAFEQPVQPGDYYLTDGNGQLNYLGGEYPQQYINRISAFKPTTTTPKPRAQLSSGLYMMGPNNVLIPVTNVNPYDLFSTNSPDIYRPVPTTTTTTTTTTASPVHKSDKIYILGPKGTLIPLNALGIKKPYGQSSHLTSSYNKWLRGMLMGEIDSEYDEDLTTFEAEGDDDKH